MSERSLAASFIRISRSQVDIFCPYTPRNLTFLLTGSRSRGFFYKNPAVRQELDRAQEQQVGMPDPRRGILDMAMDNEMNNMHEQMIALQRENEELQKEIARLQKKVDQKQRNAFGRL